MSLPKSLAGSRRLIRPLAWGSSVSLVIVAVACLLPWLAPRVPVRLAQQAAVVFLKAFLGVYLVGSVGAAVGGFFLFRSLLKARRRGGRGPLRARLLAACGSILVGSLMLEGLAWAWQARADRVEVPELRFNEGHGPNPTLTSPRDLYVVVIGESTAVGMPFDPLLSIGQIMAFRLERLFPGRRVWVDTRAGGGFSLTDALRWLSRSWRKPDMVLLYSGHNEFHAQFDVMREVPYYEDTFTLSDHAARRLRRLSSLIDLILKTLDEQLVDRPPSASGVRRKLVDEPACTLEERARRLVVYKAGLKAFYEYCERAGALPILFVPASNDGGFDPNRSVLRASTPRADREAFARAFQEAQRLETADPSKSLAGYRTLLEAQPGFAEAHFRLGRLLANSGDIAEANHHFRLARDLDQFPIRCPSDFRDACRAEGSRHDGIVIDAEEVLRPLSPRGILDEHLFLDAHHPNLVGYVALAEATVRGLGQRQAFGWPDQTPAASLVITPSEVASSFGLDETAWAQVCRRSASWYESVAPIRYDPSDRWARARSYASAAKAIEGGQAPRRSGCPGIGVEPPTP